MDGQNPDTNQESAGSGPLPGSTITPGASASPSAPPEPTPVTPPVETPIPQNSALEAPQPPQPTPKPAQPSFYHPEVAPAADAQPTTEAPASESPQTTDVAYWQGDPAESVSWTASEYIAHHKSGGWYVLLMFGALIAAALCWIITKDVVSTVVIIFAGAILATLAAKKPRQLNYQLDSRGLTIGAKHYNLHEYRSFSIVPEGAFSSIVFTPLKRFGLPTSIYYDPQDEERIINVLSHQLPHENRQPDAIDGLMRRIRL